MVADKESVQEREGSGCSAVKAACAYLITAGKCLNTANVAGMQYACLASAESAERALLIGQKEQRRRRQRRHAATPVVALAAFPSSTPLKYHPASMTCLLTPLAAPKPLCTHSSSSAPCLLHLSCPLNATRHSLPASARSALLCPLCPLCPPLPADHCNSMCQSH